MSEIRARTQGPEAPRRPTAPPAVSEAAETLRRAPDDGVLTLSREQFLEDFAWMGISRRSVR